MEYLPVNLLLRDRPVVLVGAGVVAARKARFLLTAGADLHLVAPEKDAQFDQLEELGPIHWRAREYREGDLEGATLVIAATPHRSVNEVVYREAIARSIPVNVVDSPELCTFIFPAIIDRTPITVAVSSGGASPVLARAIRSQIEALLPVATAEIAKFARRYRDRVKAASIDERDRRGLWEQVINGSIAQLILKNRMAEAERAMDSLLAEHAPQLQGEVYLIGAGPGDPDLMTFKALRLLQRADVVLYDRLVNPQIVAMARRDAEKLYVGKQRSEHAVPQERINQFLVDHARDGNTVARLKGGDPFIFGRGGEEIELLAREGIAFQVVPGITAGSAAACYAGIPLTHRDHAQSVRFVTGHTRDGKLSHRWEEFLNPRETLVFYMGLVGLPIIVEQLLAHGRDPQTPIALVEQATLPQQRAVIGTLATITERVQRAAPTPPTLIIVGDVVKLAPQLGWYGERAH